MNKTERLRRVRRLAAMARRVDYEIPGRGKYEVGPRTSTVCLHRPPTSVGECYAPNDDLWDFSPLDSWAKHGTAMDGEIVHLYFWENGEFGQRINTVTGWIGTPEHPPMLVSVPGSRLTLDDFRRMSEEG